MSPEPDRRRLDESCPRCGGHREPGQEYCLGCGLRLPATSGPLARFRRAWVHRIGWYPGDWFWTALLALLVAAGGAAVAVATTNAAGSSTGTTSVYTSPSVPVAMPTPSPAPAGGTGTLPTPPEPTHTGAATAAKSPPNGRTRWPAGASGWTVVLVSQPSTAAGKTRAQAEAARAARAGLPEVGMLVSSRYSSLHPGYFVVFSGVFDSRTEAESTTKAAHSAGFRAAYVRQIVQ